MKKAHRTVSRRPQARPQHNAGQTLLPVAVAGLVVVGLVALLVFLIGQDGGNQVRPVRVGQELSEFKLTDVNGETVHLSDYAGRVVLVNAWATWCPPCRAEMPALNAYYQEHAQDGFVILAVSAGDTPADAAAFAQAYHLAFPVLLDPQTELLNGLNVRSFPTSILVDREGIVRDIHIGLFTPDQLEATIGPLLAQ